MNGGAPIVLSIALDMLSLVSFTVYPRTSSQYNFCCQTWLNIPQFYIRRGQWTHLNPMSGEDSEHTSILVQERTGKDTPQSYIRRGQWTHLNPMLGEDQWTHLNPGSGENSEHTSILVRRGYLYIYQERPYLDPVSVWERNISIPKNRASKTPRLWRWVRWLEVWRKFVGQTWGTRRNVEISTNYKKCQQTKRC